MRIGRAFGLMTRRAIAFAIDLGLLFFFLELGCIAAMLGGLEFYDPGWSPVLVAGSLCYFGAFESLRQGQTPGKRLTRIRVRTSSGQGVTAYQAVARASLILLWPGSCVLLWRLLVVCRIVGGRGPLAEPTLSMLSQMIWPISAVIGGGRVGMHDFLLGTVVTRAREDYSARLPSVNWLYPYTSIFASAVVSGVCVSATFGLPVKQADNLFERMSEVERLMYRQVAKSMEDLSLRIENGPEFMAGHGWVGLERWTDATWKRWRVDRPCVPVPDEIREGRVKFRLHARYVIPVTARGLVSGTFQQAVCQDICRRVMGPDVFMTFEFVYRWQMWTFAVTARKGCIGFAYIDVNEEGDESTLLVLLEADEAMRIMAGIGLGDFRPGSQLPPLRW